MRCEYASDRAEMRSSILDPSKIFDYDFRSFIHAREDLEKHCRPFTRMDVGWAWGASLGGHGVLG